MPIDNDSDYEDESEVPRPKLAPTVQEEEDVSWSIYNKYESLNIANNKRRNNSIWMTYYPQLGNLENTKSYWSLAYVFQLVYLVAFVLLINCLWPIRPRTIGVKFPNYLTYHQWSRENIWLYHQTW